MKIFFIFLLMLAVVCASPTPSEDLPAEGDDAKPEDGEKKPEGDEKKPDDGEAKPDDTEGKPEDGDKKPEDGEKKPDDTEGKPADEDKNTEGDDKKPEGDNKNPDGNNNKPDGDEKSKDDDTKAEDDQITTEMTPAEGEKEETTPAEENPDGKDDKDGGDKKEGEDGEDDKGGEGETDQPTSTTNGETTVVNDTQKEEIVEVTLSPDEEHPSNVATDRYGAPISTKNEIKIKLNGGNVKIMTHHWVTRYTVPPTIPNCLCLTRGPLPLFKLIGNLHFKHIKHRTPSRFQTSENTPSTLCPPCDCSTCFTSDTTDDNMMSTVTLCK